MNHLDPNKDLIDTAEAAEILKVLPRAVREMVKEGLLMTANVVATPVHTLRFRREDVLLLAEIREKKVGYAEVVAMAQHASFNVRRLEVLVQRLLTLIGADIPTVDLRPDGVLELYRKAQLALTATEYTPEDIFAWTRVFLGIGPEFFEAITTYVRVEEPWLLFLDLARRIAFYRADRPEAATLEDTAMMQYFAMSVREMRKSAFLLVQRSYGRNLAATLFPETLGDVHNELATICIGLHQRGPEETAKH